MEKFGEIAKAGKNFVCGLYNNQPNLVIPIISDIHKFWWDDFCNPGNDPEAPPLPPPPKPLFNGGQCPVLYEVTTNGVYFTTPTDAGRPLGENKNFVYGPIVGVKTVRAGSAASGASITHYIEAKNSAGQPTDYRFAGSGGGVGVWRGYAFITGIKRMDNQPDNCGNPRPDFPPVSPAPPSGVVSPPITIVNNDNTTTEINFNFAPIPLPVPPIIAFPKLVINIEKLGAEVNVKIPVEFNFDGTINIGTGGGGGGFGQPDRDEINNIKNVINNNNEKITNIKNEITNITNNNNNAPPKPADYLPPRTNLPPGEHQQSYLAFVELSLTQVPVNAKTQSGKTASDVLYAGWFEWRRAGYNTPREPIHFKKNVFVAPKGVDGFAYTLYNGFVGTATAVSNKEKV